MVQPKLTLFTPTFNRPQYMIRLLNYYRDVKFKGRICIGDSSDHDVALQIQKVVTEIQDDIDIVYERYPGENGVECVRNLLDSITTQYAAFAADDDFFVPTALNECVDFLENNPDYSAAHGIAVLVSLASNGVYGPITNFGEYRQPSIELDNPSDRLKSLLSDYSVTLFSVHKTETWKRMYQRAHEIREWRRFGGELLQCSRSVLYGKVKQINSLSLIRQVYDTRNSLPSDSRCLYQPVNMSATHGPDEFDWVTSEDWLESYRSYLREVSYELGELENIPDEEADRMVKEYFRPYLIRALSKRPHTSNSIKEMVKINIKYVPGLYEFVRILKSVWFGNKHQLSLKALLRKSSPHNNNFMPVYRSLTTDIKLTRYKYGD